MDVMTNLTELVSNVGVSFVAFLLMYKMCNETLAKVTTALNELKTVVTKIESRLDDDKKD